MRLHPVAVLAAAALSAAAVTAGAGASAARDGASAAARDSEPTARVAQQRITAKGVGGVKVGARFATLRKRGLLGRMRPGCELAGPDTRSARLRAPLQGAVDLTRTRPRRVRTIAVSGGATARGVGIGATRAQVRSAFPKVRFDRRTEEVFGLTLARVPRDGGGRIQLAIDTETRRVTLIGVPFIPFCE